MTEPSPTGLGWTIHDAAVGGGAGVVVGFIAGLFGLQLFESVVVPFGLAAVGAVLASRALMRSGRYRAGLTLPRLVAWLCFIAGSSFLILLYQAIRDFE